MSGTALARLVEDGPRHGRTSVRLAFTVAVDARSARLALLEGAP